MASQPGQRFEIEKSGESIRYREYTAGGTALWNYYPVSNIKCIEPVAEIGYGTRDSSTNQRFHRTRQDDLLRITISFLDDTKPLTFDIQNVMNQAGWTPDAVGMATALMDINGWIVNSSSSKSAASLVAIEALLTTIQANLASYNTGQHSVSFSSPQLPYTILDNMYCAYSIVTQGSVAIDGITVPHGYSFNVSCGSNEVLKGKEITNVSGGSVFITLQEK